MLSPEIDAMKAQMTAIIMRDSEGFFDDYPKESEDLQYSQDVGSHRTQEQSFRRTEQNLAATLY
jgi:hypothetical protein